MKKIRISAVFIGAILLALSPLFMGLKIQSEVNNFIDQTNENTGYRADWISYNRGFRRSSGELQLGVRMPSNADSDPILSDMINVRMQVDVEHGPFVKDQGLGLASWRIVLTNADQLREYLAWDPNTALYQLEGILGLDGTASYSETIPALESPQDAPISFAFGGYLGHGEVINGQLTHSGKAGDTEISAANDSAVEAELFQVRMGPIEFKLHFDADLDRLFSGQLTNAEMDLVIESVKSISATDTGSFDLGSIEISSAVDIQPDQNLANIDVRYGIASINTEQFSASDIALEISFDNYSSDFQSRYTNFIQDSMYRGAAPDPAKMQQFLADTLPLLLGTAPILAIDRLAFSLSEKGSFESSAELRLDAISTLPTDLKDLSFWADKIAASVDISADKRVVSYIGNMVLAPKLQATSDDLSAEELELAVATQLQTGISMMQMMGVVIDEGQSYSTTLEYERGLTKINGEEFAIPLGAIPF